MLTENLNVFLRDFGLPCTAGAFAFQGVLDLPDDTLSMGGVNLLSTMYVLQVLSSTVATASLQQGSAISVDATSKGQGVLAFFIRDVLSVDDGVFTHLTLQK